MESDLPTLSSNARRWLWLGVLLAGLVLLGWGLLDLRPVLTPIFAALAIAYVFNPLITRLERVGVRRLYSVIGLYVVGVVVVAGLGFFLTVKTIEQSTKLRESIGAYADQARNWLGAAPAPATGVTIPRSTTAPASTAPAGTRLKYWWNAFAPLLMQHAAGVANSALGVVTGVFASVLDWISVFVLIPLFTFFFLWRFDDMVRTIREHLPARSRALVVHLAATIDSAMANFFRGRLIACFILGLATGIGWTLTGLSYSLPLGALVGVLSLVPFLSLLALPPALLVSYFDAMGADADWKLPVLLTMGVYMLVQGLDAFIFTPAVQAQSCGLHPLTTVVALLIGQHWAGLLGMLLAIPIASTLKVLAAEFVLPYVRRLAAGEGAGAPGPADAGVASAPASALVGTDDAPRHEKSTR